MFVSYLNKDVGQNSKGKPCVQVKVLNNKPKNKKTKKPLLLYSLILPLLLGIVSTAQSEENNFYIGFDVASVNGDISSNNTAAGLSLGYRLTSAYSLELISRTLLSGEDSGQLNSAMAIWRSETAGLYYKASGGITSGAKDAFEDTSASFGFGIGYSDDSHWSVELDLIRLSDDVNALSLNTRYRF